ncbi:FecR family protein [Mucilaginibacter pocheonensis]|uniref:Ferric-dicitrate binding protein FerR (Iron transport regulator) n=1 Tax=Mucilaginibacter pocheonensis TaxID=398050 RepID=A0ABU1T7H5_9SPHI|nr:FecR family protein [Mucilaginibacter pocheonensis]MDR6941186.1 ferric-dicitrate binding protein FerR (iron transport regulator) [Mucilaginibacter pocheonensis]
MDNSSFNPQELAHKWLAGTLTPEERSRFEQWYADFNDEELLLSDSKYTTADQIRATMHNRLTEQMGKPEVPKMKIYTLWPRVAAAAAIVFAVGMAVLYRVPILNLINPVRQVQLTSKPGQYRQIYLADGTHVWLSPATTISYPEKFRGKQREVTITGEAYFEVEHDAAHPFVIQSGAVKTVVLGTSFDIQAYPRSASIEVTVVNGKVGVSATGKTPELITADQRTIYHKATATLIKENYPAASKFLNQRKGIFDFKGTSLQQVAHELETQYGVQISLAPGLTNKAFYGRLQTTTPINRTLNKLCAVMETRWEKQGSAYILHP